MSLNRDDSIQKVMKSSHDDEAREPAWITGLWIGNSLPPLAELCIRSYQDHGFKFRLLTYDDVENLPEGVERFDASVLLARENLFIHSSGSLAPAADRIRYEYLARYGGLWTDMDVVCLRPFEPTPKPYFALQEPGLSNLAVLDFPPGHPVMTAMAERMADPAAEMPWDGVDERSRKAQWRAQTADVRERRKQAEWSLGGPEGFTEALRHFGLQDQALPEEAFSPVPYTCWRWNFDGNFTLEDERFARSLGIHLWGELLRREPDAFENLSPTSVVARLMTRHGCEHRLPSSAVSGPNLPDRSPKILIGICSCRSYVERRQVVRETWLTKPQPGIEHRFFVGNGDLPCDEPDTVTVDANDTYEWLPSKVIAFFKHALKTSDFDWLFKCDEDTYVDQERLRELPAEDADLIGNEFLSQRGSPSGGAGYLLSRRAIELIANDSTIALVGCEDIIIGEAAIQLGARWRATDRLCWDTSRCPRPDNDVITSHWCSPERMRAIHAIQDLTPRKIEVEHAHWRDNVLLYPNHYFTRRSTACDGTWKQIESGAIRLDWKNWGPEVLIPHEREKLESGDASKPSRYLCRGAVEELELASAASVGRGEVKTGVEKIPRIIHACWFSGEPLGALQQYCLDSWRKFCPDYEIKIWDLNNWDASRFRFSAEASKHGQWAFASDVFRLDILHEIGGIYLDFDVSVERPFDDLLGHEFFTGTEKYGGHTYAVTPYIMGCVKGNALIKRWRDYYDSERGFVNADGSFERTPNTELMHREMQKLGAMQKIDEIEEFLPGHLRYPSSMVGYAIPGSYAVHHFDGAWLKQPTGISACGKEARTLTFNRIYAGSEWGEGSGPGSTPRYTTQYRDFLQSYIARTSVQSVLDIGCGDWQFSSLIDWTGIDYLGVDVSPSVITNLREHYSRDGVRFEALDAVTEPLPPADLVIVKDCLQHLSLPSIHSILEKLKVYDRCLVTQDIGPHNVNGECEDGGYRCVDLSLPPFNLQVTKVFDFGMHNKVTYELRNVVPGATVDQCHFLEMESSKCGTLTEPTTDDTAVAPRDLAKFLQPKMVGSLKLRLGNPHGDGGYIVNERALAESDILYSYGVSNEWSFDSAWIAVTGKRAWLFDHTVNAITGNPDLVFIKSGVSGIKTAETDTVMGHLATLGHLNKRVMLKMDVEGCEFEALEAIADADLLRFTCMVIEFHMLGTEDGMRLRALLERIERSFTLFHIHGNNWAGTFWSDGVELPCVMELSFMRTDLCVPTDNVELYPTALDVPNHPGRPEYPLPFIRCTAVDPEFTCVTCVGRHHLGVAVKSIRSLLENTAARRVTAITSKANFPTLAACLDGLPVDLVDEDSVIPCMDLRGIRDYLDRRIGEPDKAGWYFQQFLKLAACCRTEGQYVLMWDSDTVAIKPIRFFDGDGRIFVNPQSEHHEPYFRPTKKLLGLEKRVDFSFICEHMMVDSRRVREMTEAIGKGGGCHWAWAVLDAIDDFDLGRSGFSEYETYGNWMAGGNSALVCRPLKSLREGAVRFGHDPSYADLAELAAEGYSYATFETWHQPPTSCFDVAVYVLTCGDRPFLQQTLDSALARKAEEPALRICVRVVANQAGPEAKKTLASYRDRLDSVVYLEENMWAGAFDRLMPTVPEAQTVILSEDDVVHTAGFGSYAAILRTNPDVGIVSGQMSPEHPHFGTREFDGGLIYLKREERAQCMAFRAVDLQSMRPFPARPFMDGGGLDWWVSRDAPNSCRNTGRCVAVLPGGVRHIGAPISTWQGATAEYTAREISAFRFPTVPPMRVFLEGGLGNQMFQYAFGLAAAKSSGAELQLDLSWFNEHATRRFGLRDFECPAPDAPWGAGAHMPWDERLIEYVDSVETELRQAFALRNGWSPTAERWANTIMQAPTPVAVHVRRGDFVGNPLHGICDESYSERTMRRILLDVPGAEFFVFSDEIDWCRRRLSNLDLTVQFVSGGMAETEELHLMATCRHHVIPNSTFSWWASWLGRLPGQIVVIPDGSPPMAALFNLSKPSPGRAKARVVLVSPSCGSIHE